MKPFLIIIFIFISLSIFSQSAMVTGVVKDKMSNQPIAFANILVVDTTLGTTTDLNGNFSIFGLQPGYQRLQISFVGYKTQTTQEIFISNNNNPFIEIELETDEETLNEVVIANDPFRKNAESIVSMQSIGTKEIENNPGSNRDISRVIQSFPGVGSTPNYRNDIIIRGGGPSENRFFLEGVEIPVLNHFSTQGASGGPVGIINADFIKKVDFYASAFPATKYNALSGVLDFKLKEGSRDETNYQFTLGASETAFTIDGPIGKNTSYIVSVRRSYLQFLFEAIGLPFLPTYNDYQLKLKTDIDKKNTFTLISIGSLDHLKLNANIENPDESQAYILSKIPVNNQRSYTIGGVFKHYANSGLHTFVLSRNRLYNQLYKYPDNDQSKAKTLDYLSTEVENKFRYELNFIKSAIKYSFSTNLEYANYTNQTAQQVFLNNNLINFNNYTNIDVFKYGFSGQVSKRSHNNRFLMSVGIRFDGNNFNDNTKNLLKQTAPRLSVSYKLTENTTINAGLGRYFQQAAYTTKGYKDQTNVLINANSVKYIGLNQYNLGFEKKYNKKALWSVEGFYKAYFQYPVDVINGVSLANQGASYDVSGASNVNFNGKGKAYGFEILNRLNLKTFNWLASYTYVRSFFTDINNHFVPSSWDSKHLLTFTGSKTLKKNWTAGFKWRFVGGLPYTPYDLEISAKVLAWNANGQAYFDYNQLNKQRFKAFHQLDIRIDKNYFYNKWTLMLYIDIQNAYNFKNTGQDYIIREQNQDNTYKTINNGSDYVLKAVANQSGTILPTIGVIIKF